MNTIRINGVTVEVPDGCSVSVSNGEIVINGQSAMTGLTGTIKLEITGNPINVESWYDVTVYGNVQGKVLADGNVTVSGGINGGAVADGNITCGEVQGDISAAGNVVCKNITGKVKASGNVVCSGRG